MLTSHESLALQGVHSRSKWQKDAKGCKRHIPSTSPCITMHGAMHHHASPFFCTFICTAATPSEPHLLCSRLPSLSFQIELKQREKIVKENCTLRRFLVLYSSEASTIGAVAVAPLLLACASNDGSRCSEQLPNSPKPLRQSLGCRLDPCCHPVKLPLHVLGVEKMFQKSWPVEQ